MLGASITSSPLCPDDERQAVRAAALNVLSSVRAYLGSLDDVARVVKLFGMVNSSAGFERQVAVIDLVSDVFIKISRPEFCQDARSVVGMFELSHRYPIEVGPVLELR